MRISPFVLSGLVAAVLMAGCSAQQPVYNGQVADHSLDDFDEVPKAVYANQVPLYPDARIVDAMGSESWGDEEGSYTRGMGWMFEFPKERTDDVVAFYAAALPHAEREVDENGAQMWTFVPVGAEQFERVTVRVGKGEMWLHEDVRPRPSRQGS